MFIFSCVYRFESEEDERIRITIKRIVTSNRQCLSRVDPDTKRSYCFGDQRAKLEVWVIYIFNFQEMFFDSLVFAEHILNLI